MKKASKSKVIKEYGGMEKYPNKAAMMKHEKMESKSMESKEKKMEKLMKKGKK